MNLTRCSFAELWRIERFVPRLSCQRRPTDTLTQTHLICTTLTHDKQPQTSNPPPAPANHRTNQHDVACSNMSNSTVEHRVRSYEAQKPSAAGPRPARGTALSFLPCTLGCLQSRYSRRLYSILKVKLYHYLRIRYVEYVVYIYTVYAMSGLVYLSNSISRLSARLSADCALSASLIVIRMLIRL